MAMPEPEPYSDGVARIYDLLVEADGSPEAHGEELNFVLWALHGACEREVADVLDVGCGTGRHLIPLVREGYRITGLDNSPGMIAECRRKLDERGLSAELSVGGMEDVAADGACDAVLCMNSVICYLLETERIVGVLRRFYRALRPGGLLLVDNWNFLAQWDRFGYPFEDERARGDVRIEYADQHWLDDFASVYHIEVEATVHEPGRTWQFSRRDELRAMTVGEMTAYLKEAGFADIRAYPSFDLSEAEEPSGERMIFLATRP